MIVLTRLNGQQLVLNAERIRYVESTPDTLVCCDGGDKYVVREAIADVVRKSIDWARMTRQPLAV